MAETKQYVDLNLQAQKLKDAVLETVGLQYVADASALATLAGTLSGETRKIFVWQSDAKTLQVWNGTAFDAINAPVTGALNLRGGITITTQLVAADNIKKGDLWIFTNAGNWFNTVTGVTGADPGFATAFIVEPGDYAIFTGTPAGTFATTAEIGAEANWSVIQNNVSAATTTTLGLAREATQAQVNTGVSGSPSPAFVTPETNKATLAARKVQSLALALAANTPTDVTHNFTTSGYITDKADVRTGVFLTSTGEAVNVSVINAANKVTLESNKPITVDVVVSAL